MFRRLITCTAVAAIASVAWAATGRVTPRGRAIVEYNSDDVLAVASYGYSQRHHAEPWLLIEFAIQAKHRIAIHRNELSLIGPTEQRYPAATQAEFLDDQPAVQRLLQNAAVLRQPLSSFFNTRPVNTIRFFSKPGGIVQESAVTNLDEVAMGDVLFKSPAGSWPAGDYRLVLAHERVQAELPITLE
jgi:hypothetical protein